MPLTLLFLNLLCFSDKESLFPHIDITLSVHSMYMYSYYLGKEGLSLKTPFISLVRHQLYHLPVLHDLSMSEVASSESSWSLSLYLSLRYATQLLEGLDPLDLCST